MVVITGDREYRLLEADKVRVPGEGRDPAITLALVPA
jgi:hypothetical protein